MKPADSDAVLARSAASSCAVGTPARMSQPVLRRASPRRHAPLCCRPEHVFELGGGQRRRQVAGLHLLCSDHRHDDRWGGLVARRGRCEACSCAASSLRVPARLGGTSWPSACFARNVFQPSPGHVPSPRPALPCAGFGDISPVGCAGGVMGGSASSREATLPCSCRAAALPRCILRRMRDVMLHPPFCPALPALCTLCL